jgi:hypothetical protein
MPQPELGIALILMALASLFGAFVVEPAVRSWLNGGVRDIGGQKVAMAVSFLCLVAAAMTAWDIIATMVGRRLSFALPTQLTSWLLGTVPLAVGWLIGTTVFR